MNDMLKYAPDITACFTGHRQISHAEETLLNRQLDCHIHKAFGQGYRRFICGGALGFDTLAARAVISFRRDHPESGVQLIMAIPCRGQENRWSIPDRNIDHEIRSQYDCVAALSP